MIKTEEEASGRSASTNTTGRVCNCNARRRRSVTTIGK